MKKRKKIQIFRLEDRVLFEGAAAAEATAAVGNAGNPSHADKPAPGQEAKDNVQKDAVHNVVQAAGPVSDPASSSSSAHTAPNAPVQDHGAGLPSADHAAADPTAALVDGTAHLAKLTDPGESFSTDLSNFMHSDLSSSHTASSVTFSSSLPADADHANSLSHAETKQLIVIEADAADNVDPHTLEGKEVLVLKKDADASAQIDAYLEAHSDVKYDAIKIVSSKAEKALSSNDLSADALTEIQSHLTNHGSLGFVDAADFNADPANAPHDLSHGADSHSTDNLVVFPDHETHVTVDAATELATGVSDTAGTAVPESLLENAASERHELVIVNSNMADLNNVLSQLGDSRDVLIIDVNSSESATRQIQDYLDAHSDTSYDSIHILTHGNSDGFKLGNTLVNDASDMAVFKGHLTQDGDIMIYGCNLASTEAGQHLINDIADVTGADVAASADMTGAAAVGGNWTLEYTTGTIETTSITLNSTWDHRLASYTIGGGGAYVDVTDAITGGATLNGDVFILYGDVDESASLSGTFTNVSFTSNGDYSYTYSFGNLNIASSFTVGDGVNSITMNTGLSGAGNVAVQSLATLNISGGALTGTITNSGDLTITSGTFGGTITNDHTATISGGTFSGAVTNNGTVDATGGTFTNTFTNNGTFNIGTVPGLDSTVTFNITGTNPAIVNNGDLNVSGLSASDTATLDINVTGGATATGISNSGTGTVDIGQNGTIDIANTATTTAYGINNAGGDIVIDGTLNVTNTLSGAAPASYGIYSTGAGSTIDLNASGEMDFKTSFTNPAGYTDSYNRVFGIYNSAGTLNLSGGLLTTSSVNPDSTRFGTGIYNTGTLNIVTAGTTIDGFEYGVRGTTVIDRTNYEAGNVDLSGNTWDQVIPLRITADPNIGTFGTEYDRYSFQTIDSALTYVSATASSAFDINFVLDNRYYNSWLAASTITQNHIIGNNVFSINGNDFIYDISNPLNPLIHYDSQTTVGIAAGVTLTIASFGRTAYDGVSGARLSETLLLNNISFNVANGGTLLFSQATDTAPAQYSRVTFSGNGVGYTYIGYANNSGNVTWTGVASSYTSARILNAGTATINGEVIHDSSAVAGGQVVYTIWNTNSNALLTIDGQYGTGILNTAGGTHVTYAIYNQFGTVEVLNGALVSLTATGTGSAAIYNAKTSAGNLNIVTIGRDDIADKSIVRIISTGASGETYAIYNNEDLFINNSYIRATGSSSIGLFNATDGDAIFTVTVNPDAYISQTDIDSAGFTSNAATNARLFGTMLFGITGGAYSLYNYNQFTMTYSGVSVTGALYTSPTTGTPYFFNVPVMSLNGEAHTEAKASTPTSKTTTNLNGVTVFGNITNTGTALVMLNNVYLNGNLLNTGSNVYVTGSFRSSDFYFGPNIGSYQQYHGQSTTSITTRNYGLLGSAGNIHFGTASPGSGYSSDVVFEPTQNYQFWNDAGTMTILNFEGLSSEEHPVLIYNQGVFTIDGSTATSGLAANGSYDLYVSLGTSVGASGTSDAGIVNYDVNQYNPVYYVINNMTLTSLNIRNTQTNSVAVTNYAGNLTITNGSLQGSYSGLDLLFDFYNSGSFSTTMTVFVKTPVTNLNQVEKIVGGAYSIRNSGKLTLDGTGVNTDTTNGTLLTNVLDFTSAYNGTYTALLNVSPTVYLNEYYTSKTNDFNDIYVYVYTGVQAFGDHPSNAGTQSSSPLVPARVTISYYAADNVFSKSDITISTYADMLTVIRPDGTYINWHYGNYAVTAEANLDYVAFYANATIYTNTAMMNWGSLAVAHINEKDEYQFTGFTVSINNGYTPFWATDYIRDPSTGDPTANNLNNDWFCSSAFTAAVAQYFTVKGDIEVGFDLQSSTIRTSSNTYETSELTLRGAYDTSTDLYDGTMLVSGGRYVVYVGKTLTLVNFSVVATSSDAIYNAGRLNIFNGEEQPDGSWKGPSNAAISATNRTAITNNGVMIMINGAVLNSAIGVEQLQFGAMMILNSTFYGNSNYAIISSAPMPTSEDSLNFVVIDTTIVGSGNGILLNTGRLDIANTIILGAGGLNLNVKTGATVNYHNAESSNIIGNGNHDTMTKLSQVFGQLSPPLDTTQNVVNLKDGSSALTGGVRFSYTKTAAGGYRLYINQTPPSGAIEVTWDKSGNDRVSASGDIAIGSYTKAGSPIVAVKVMTLKDEDNGDTTYSLREVINWLQSSSNTNQDTAVTFDWGALLAEEGDPAKWVFNLDAVLGSLVLNGANAAGITDITINGQYTNASGVTFNVTVNGDALTSSVFTVDGMSLMLTNIAVDGSGTSTTAVDANGAAVHLGNNAQLVLNGGVTITGGNTTGLGGAVYIGAGTILTLQNAGNAFMGNTAASGGAIYNMGTVNVVSTAAVTLSGNTATQNGGAVYNAGTFAFDATGTGNLSFSDNGAANGGAVYNTGTFTSNTASTLSFSDNRAENGGAVYNTGAFTVSATTATFTDNTATQNGGAIYNESGTLTVSGTFTGNSAVNGGAIDMHGGTGTVGKAYFVSNSAADGGAVYVGGGSIRLEQSTLMFNRASHEGTAVYVAGGRFDAVNTTIAKNGIDRSDPSVTDSGYAIFATDAAQLYLADVTVADNSSGISLGGTSGTKILVNSIVLNTTGTNLSGHFTNEGVASYGTNYVGTDRTLVFGTNQLIVDPTSTYYGTISLNDSTSNPAMTGGALVALDGGVYYYSTNGGTTWKSAVTDAVTTLSSAAVVFNTDQAGSSRTLGSNYSMGAVAIPTDAIFVVNTSADTIDDTDGVTSLREAIIAANQFAALYPNKNITIVFDVAHITSTQLVNGTVTLTSSLPDLHCSVTINGWNETYNPSHSTVTVTAAAATLTASPLTIMAGNVTISNITFVGGNLQAAGSSGTGGMFSITGGTTTFNHVTIGGGTAAMGGAVYIAAGVTVEFNNSTLSGNTALYRVTTTVDTTVTTHYYMGKGGAVYNAGTLQLNNSTISNNTTGGTRADVYDQVGQGGGIYNAGTLTVNASALTGNTAGKDGDTATGEGGAIYNAKNLVINAATVIVTYDLEHNPIYAIDDSTITTIANNTSYQSGGAIYNAGAGTAFVYLEGNNISGNSAVNGGALYNAGTLTVTDNAAGTHRPTNKLLAFNSASNQGGAIYNAKGNLTLTYATLTGNSAATDGSAVYFAGGTGTIINATFAGNTGSGATIAVAAGSLNIKYATIALNTTTGLNIAGGTVILQNSLLAGNGTDGASDISGTYTDNKGNVISNGLYSTSLLFETGTLDANDGTLHLRSTLLNPAAVGGVYDKNILVDQNGQTRYYDATEKEASVGAWAFTTKPTTGYRFVVTIAEDVVNDGDGYISLREAIAYVNQKGGSVYFDYAEIMKNSGTLTLSVDAALGSFAITGNMTIDGISYSDSLGIDFRAGYHNQRLTINGSTLTAASLFTVTGVSATFTTLNMVGGTTSGNGGVFNITGLTPSKTITMTALNVSGGKAASAGGAIFQDSGNLVIQGSSFYGATAGTTGGSIHFTGNTLTVKANTNVILRETDNHDGTFTVLTADYVNSFFYNNTATAGSGGAIYFAGTSLYVSAGAIVTETNTLYEGTGIYDPAKQVKSTTLSDVYSGYAYFGANESGASGGAIYVGQNTAGTMSTVSLSSAFLYLNKAAGSGGGIFMTNGGLSITASQFYSNTSGATGGGIYFDGTGSLTLSGSYVENNTATGSGGGIYFAGNTLTLSANYATYLLARNVNPDGSVTVDTANFINSAVYDNVSKTGSGGGIYFAGNTLSLTGSGTDVIQTTTVYNPDGTVRSTATSTLANSSNIVIGSNTATAGDGGGVYIQENTSADVTLRITLTNATVSYNYANKGRGGAFYLTPSANFSFIATNTTVTGNSALNGGAFYFASEISSKATLVLPTLLSYNYAEQNGGAIYAVGNLKWSSAVTFTGNTSKGSGGALYVEGDLNISGNSVFNSNGTTERNGDGGAIYVGGNLTISGGTFTNNYASNVFSDGGAIYVVGTVDMSGSVIFTGNMATSGGKGGAVYVGGGASGGASKIDGVTATLNFGADGGVFYFASGTVTVAGRSGVSLNNNTGFNGGAIYIASGTTVTIGKEAFSLNNNMAITGVLLNSDGTSDNSIRVGGNGGAVYNNGTLTINRTNKTWLTFDGNQAVGYDKFTNTGFGGFIYNVGTVELSYVNVNNSASSRSGGAIYSYGSSSSVSLTMANFTGNQTKAFSASTRAVGGGSTTVDATKAEGNGGAVYMEGGTLTIDSSTFTNNSATNINDKNMNVDKGGAVYFSGSGALTIKSTVKDTSYTVSFIETTTFSGNEAARGGALYVDAAAGATVSISDVSVENNIGRYTTDDGIASSAAYVSQGAGFWLGGSSSSVRITIENTTFSGNTQEYITWGGGLYVTGVGLNLINTTFYNNTANHGGGLYIADANVSMVNSTVGYNRVTDILHSGLGGGGILVTGASTTLNMLNTVVAGNINTRYVGLSSYQYNDIVFKLPSLNNITMKYNVLGYAWNSIDSTTYSGLTATELGSTNTYKQLGSDVFQQQTVGGVEVPVFERFFEWARYYAASHVIFNPVYATTATLMIRPDGVAAYKGVYSAIDRSTGALYYNTINSSKVTSTTDISGSWVNFADDSSVTITNSNIVTNGQNGWTRTDQLTFNTYNVGAHALKPLDANYYAGPDYEYDVSKTYYVNPTVTKAYTDTNQYYYDAFNPYDGAITLREAVFLAGQTVSRSYYSSDPDVQSLTETFVFSKDIRFNTDPNYPGNVFGTHDGGSPTSTYYTPTTNLFTGSDFIVLDSYYGALTFNKAGDTGEYTLAGLDQDGNQLDIVIAGTSGGLLNVVGGNLIFSNFTALEGGYAAQGGVFNVSGGMLWVRDIAEIHGGSAQQGGFLYQSGGTVFLGDEGFNMLIDGHEATQGGVIYQTGGTLGLLGNLTFADNRASVGAWIYQTGGLLSSLLFGSGGIAQANIMVTDNYSYVFQSGGESSLIHQDADGDIQLYNTTVRNTFAVPGETGRGLTTTASALFTVNGIFTLLNSTVTNNMAHGAVANSVGGTIYIVDSTVAFNSGGVKVAGVVTSTSTETAADGTVTTVTNTKGGVFVLNSILTANNGVSLTVTEGAGRLVNYSLVDANPNQIFVMTGGKPVEGPHGTLVIKANGLAGNGGVLVGVYQGGDEKLHFAYKTSPNGAWINWASDVSITTVSEIAFGQNGISRYELGGKRFCIGAYATDGTIIPDNSLIVTTGDDTMDPYDGKTSLREALEYAQSLYDEQGIVCTVLFDTDQIGGTTVTIDYTLDISNYSVKIDGGSGITVNTEMGFFGTMLFNVEGNNNVFQLTNITVDGGYRAQGLVSNGADVTVTGGAFVNTVAVGSDGAAISMNGGSLKINGTAFNDNNATGNGGSIYANGSTVTMNGGSITHGSAAQGGGIYGDHSTFILKNVTVDGNDADEGAGVYLAGGVLTATGVSFSNNTAATGNGGAIAGTGAVITLQNSSFTNNAATAGSGGAVYNAGGQLSVTGGTFTNNSAGESGGAVYNAGGNLSLNGTFTDNSAGKSGGAVYNASGSLSVKNGSFTGNNAADGDGGAIYSAGGPASITGVSFSGNKAADGDGGAVYSTAQTLSVSGSSFSGNSAENGGAVYTSSATSTLYGGSFTGNKAADGDGGAVYNNGGSLKVSGSFTNNAAANGNGGAVYNVGTMVVNSGSFTGNTAQDGAAIYSTGSADIMNFGFVSNEAFDGSVIKMNGGFDLYMNNGSLRNNTGTHLVDTAGKAALLTTTTAFNSTASSVLNTASLDLVNSTITGSTTDNSALIQVTKDLQIANSIVVGNTADVRAVEKTGTGKFYTAYSIFSGNAAQLADASVNVENLTGYSFGAVFGGGQVSAFGQLAIPADSPAAMGVWTTYNRATGDIHYSTRPEGVWTVGYNVNRVEWNYLGPGSKMSTFSLSNLVVVGNGHPSVGAYWLNSESSLPDFGPGINSDFSNPSYNGMITDWGYNSVVNAFMAGTDLYLTLGTELPMGWLGNLSRQLFGAPYAEMDSFSVFGGRGDLGGTPSGENDLGISINGATSDDFTRFEETPYHSDGTPLTLEEIELIRTSALRGSVEEEAIPTLSETLGEKVLSALRSADIFKDSFDKALDQLLGADA